MDEKQGAAHNYAETGWPVFPLIPGEKLPVTRHGFQDASTDHGQIQRWWGRNPERNIGIATGAPGPDVLDIDVKGKESGYPAFNRLQREGLTGNPRAYVKTPSGGLHVYYRGTEQRNGSIPRAHVDFRSQGGYVVAPPSEVGGRPYAVVRHQASDAEFDWAGARELLDPQPQRTGEPGKRKDGAQADIDALAKFIESKPSHHNDALYWAACRAVEAGQLEGLDKLKKAAMRTGHRERLADRTIQSAIDTVTRSPRHADREAGQ